MKPKVKTIAIITATVKAPAKLPMNTRPQLRSTPPIVTPGRLSISASGASTNTPVAGRSRTDTACRSRPETAPRRRSARRSDTLTRDRKRRGEREDRAGHVGADDRIARRHEDFGFSGVDHLGHEFRRHEIGHSSSPCFAERIRSERRQQQPRRCKVSQAVLARVPDATPQQNKRFCVGAADDTVTLDQKQRCASFRGKWSR